jgi:hypothetical protein
MNTMSSVGKALIGWLGWESVPEDLVTPVVNNSHL